MLIKGGCFFYKKMALVALMAPVALIALMVLIAISHGFGDCSFTGQIDLKQANISLLKINRNMWT